MILLNWKNILSTIFNRPVRSEREKYDMSWSKQAALMNTFKIELTDQMIEKQNIKVRKKS